VPSLILSRNVVDFDDLAPNAIDNLIIDTLSTQIPIVVLPRIPQHINSPSYSMLSSFRPSSAIALRTGLFHSPETIATLRGEAADRFLRWREVERAVDDIHMSQRNDTSRSSDGLHWDKAKWESEWVANLSHDVARRLREGTLTERNVRGSHNHKCSDDPARSCVGGSYDPLHLPSLVIFSISLLGPLRARFNRSVAGFLESFGDPSVRMALLGGFCMGLGIGLYMKSAQ
jgi:hypothetical protein